MFNKRTFTRGINKTLKKFS